MPTKVKVIRQMVEVGQKSHVHVDHDRLALLQQLKHGLFGFSYTSSVMLFNPHARPPSCSDLQPLLPRASDITPTPKYGLHALDMPVDESHPGPDTKQHLLADRMVVEIINVKHRAGYTMMGLQRAESIEWFEGH